MHRGKVTSGQKTKSFVRLLPSRGNSQVLISMWFNSMVQIGITYTMRMETNPATTGYIFYMYIENTCKRNPHTLHCERTNSEDLNHKEDYLEAPIVKRMPYVGNGLYEETYTINHKKTGYASASTYLMMHGVRGLCYDNEDFSGPPVKTFIGNNIAYDWQNTGLCNEGSRVKGLMFRGRLLVSESGTYQLIAGNGILIRLVLIGYHEEEDFKSNGLFVPLRVEAGEYDYIIYIKTNSESPQAMVYWVISASLVISRMNLLYSVLNLTPNNIRITCFPGHYLNVTRESCLGCSKGTYTDQHGLTECIRCGPGTFNKEERAIRCEKCPAMTYGDGSGLTKCTPCPRGSFTYGKGSIECTMCDPLCSECFGPYNTQCGSCVESTGVLFILPNTCQCPDGTYYESYLNKCTHCHLLCSSCTGPSSTQCKGCNTPIAYEVESLPSLCVTECPESYYKDFSTCKCTFLF